MALVLFQRLGIDEEIIKVRKEEDVEELSERVVHKMLERSWGSH